MLGFLSKKSKESLDKGLGKTREGIFSRLTRALGLRKKVDEGLLDDLEEALLSADVGLSTTSKIIAGVEAQMKQGKVSTEQELSAALCAVTCQMLEVKPRALEALQPTPGVPYVVLVVGVNGVGKTTTIGKLAHRYRQQGKRVYIGAADTFRAAAIDQLKVWSERVGAELVSQKMGADPAAVAYDTLAAAKAQGADVVLIDTAGRLHNKVNLMNELGKIKRVLQKIAPEVPQEVLLVLDGSTGQNAFEQAKQFAAVTDLTALALTKLDGTARGGVAIGICDQLQVPIKYIGVGEQMDDLQLFDPRAFVESIFG